LEDGFEVGRVGKEDGFEVGRVGKEDGFEVGRVGLEDGLTEGDDDGLFVGLVGNRVDGL